MPTILIVEDNLTLLGNTSEFLELEGYKVITATDGKRGLQQIFKLVPDLVICDLLIPEMDGFELLKRLGRHPKCNTIPVVFFSAKTEKGDIQKGLDAGAYDYITKPFELDDLLLTIERCLKNQNIQKKN